MSKEKKLEEFAPISEQLIAKLGVQALPDRPNASGMYGNSGKSATELKKWFDQLATTIAGKINALQSTFASEDIAKYIRIALDKYDIEHLQDLVDSFGDGTFADEVLHVYPNETAEKTVTLRNAFALVNQKIATEIDKANTAIAEAKKMITDLGYGYTDSEVEYIEDGGETYVDVETVDVNGARRLIFKFYNISRGVAEIVLAIPITNGEAENSIVQPNRENKAVTENSIAFGEGSIAGAKGFYFKEIFYGNASTNPQIRVSSVQPTEAGLFISSSALNPNPIFVAPDYTVGDVFNLICNDHFTLVGRITNIENDIITFDDLHMRSAYPTWVQPGANNAGYAKNELVTYNGIPYKSTASSNKKVPNTLDGWAVYWTNIEDFKTRLALQVSYKHAEWKSNNTIYYNLVPDYDDYTLCVPRKPFNGIVEVCKTAFTSGCENISAGAYGEATGKRNVVVGAYGHTEGSSNLAGYSAHAEGQDCEAPAKYSHAQNKTTKATGYASHAQNVECEAKGEGATAEGYRTKAKMKYSHTEGNATETNADTVPLADGAHAEGRSTKATNYGAHAEGAWTVASGEYSHAQNYETTASGTRATSMGHRTTASGSRAVAEGEGTIASGYCSHAAGFFTKATSGSQFVVGDYNKENSNAYLIVGNGTSDSARSNAFEVLKDGNIKMPHSNFTKAAIGEFYANGNEIVDTMTPITLYFDFTPCIVVVYEDTGASYTKDSRVYPYDPDTMHDNSWTYMAYHNEHSHYRYCAIGYENLSYDAPITKITATRTFDGGTSRVEFEKTYKGEFPQIKTIAEREENSSCVWYVYINGTQVTQVGTYAYANPALIISTNKNSEGTGVDDYVHTCGQSQSIQRKNLVAGKTYDYYLIVKNEGVNV